ncbi:hypothetical protein AAE478_000914 [Parahypoxylon ruwenzoriense]
MVRVSAAVFASALLGTAQATARYMNLTAITGRDNISVLECWQLSAPFEVADAPGVAGALALPLGSLDSASYIVIPPRFDGGRHNPPVKQYIWSLTGVVHVTLPNATDDAFLYGGKYGLLYADDTPDISEWGHVTSYPSGDQVIVLSIPVKDNVNPEHTVLHDGPCTVEETVDV